MSEEEYINIKVKCRLLKYMGEIENFETGEIKQYFMKENKPYILLMEE